jgi:DNA polymerase
MSKDPPDDASRFIPPDANLDELRAAAAGCTACPLHETGTQTVFGEGGRQSRIMLVGEQPGDYEDRAGEPFVGPAGKLLDRALADAGIDRSRTYVTNAVKHFKWVPRGKRRIHSKPSSMEIAACHPWLEREIELVAPEILVCLGATAAQALLGKSFRVTKQRGEFVASNWAPRVMATIHPSALLRAPDEATRHAEYERFVADLRKAGAVLGSRAPREPGRDRSRE